MATTEQMAKHLRQVLFGGNWAGSNLKDNLSGLTWQQATTKIYEFNSIASLTFHSTYYITALLKVLSGKPLDSKDEYSFDLPTIQSQSDWDQLQEKIWSEANEAATLIEKLPDSILSENFVDEKYGSYYRNISGTIEHLHYHLGQIALIKKLFLSTAKL